jgi:hypothetical protein
MNRTRLPDRRPNLTAAVKLADRAYAVTIGFYPDGRVGEVFAHGAKVGSEIDFLLDDACVAISLLLQLGADPAALAASMGRLGDGRSPVSIIGALVDLVAREAAS